MPDYRFKNLIKYQRPNKIRLEKAHALGNMIIKEVLFASKKKNQYR